MIWWQELQGESSKVVYDTLQATQQPNALLPANHERPPAQDPVPSKKQESDTKGTNGVQRRISKNVNTFWTNILFSMEYGANKFGITLATPTDMMHANESGLMKYVIKVFVGSMTFSVQVKVD
jgi:hypothetical protein